MNANISWTVVIRVPIKPSLLFSLSVFQILVTEVPFWPSSPSHSGKKLSFHTIVIIATISVFPSDFLQPLQAYACALGYLCLILCFPLLRKTRAEARASTWVVSDKYPISLYIEYFLPPACMCAQSCPTLCDPLDCSPPGSSVHGISQARILEQVTTSYYRGSSRPRDQSQVYWVSWIGRWVLYHLEALLNHQDNALNL